MRKLALLATIAAVVAGLAAPQVAADPPEHFVFVDDATFPAGGLTAACGTPVFITVAGRLHIKLRTDKNGVLREQDHFQNWSLTISAPSTGRSFSFKLGPGFFDYPNGTAIGAAGTLKVTGIQQDFPGLHAEAGHFVFPTEVIAVTPEGIPIVDIVGPPLVAHGNPIDPAVATAAACAYLTGS
jgi:hypothetical protein